MHQYKKKIKIYLKQLLKKQNECQIICRFIEETFACESSSKIILLPLIFKGLIKEDALMKLVTANMCGWIAYTIFDDILDNQIGSELLPIAESLSRRMYDLYFSLLPSQKDRSFIMEIFDRADESYFLEKKFCHLALINNQISLKNFEPYNDHDFVRQKSMGCSVNIIIALLLINIPPRNTLDFFRKFLSARQLSDDAADWFDDLKSGIQTEPTCMILSTWKKSGKLFVDLDIDKPKLEVMFWQTIAPQITKQILNITNSARKSLAKMKNSDQIKNLGILEEFLHKIEQGAKGAIKIKR